MSSALNKSLNRVLVKEHSYIVVLVLLFQQRIYHGNTVILLHSDDIFSHSVPLLFVFAGISSC